MNLKFGTGMVKVEMNDAFDRIARRAIDRIAPGVVEVIERPIEEIFIDTKNRWTRKSGVSNDGLQRGVVLDPGLRHVRGTVWNDVVYAKFVRLRSLGGKSAFVELMRKPLKYRVREVAQAIARRAAVEIGG